MDAPYKKIKTLFPFWSNSGINPIEGKIYGLGHFYSQSQQ